MWYHGHSRGNTAELCTQTHQYNSQICRKLFFEKLKKLSLSLSFTVLLTLFRQLYSYIEWQTGRHFIIFDCLVPQWPWPWPRFKSPVATSVSFEHLLRDFLWDISESGLLLIKLQSFLIYTLIKLEYWYLAHLVPWLFLTSYQQFHIECVMVYNKIVNAFLFYKYIICNYLCVP